MTGHLLRSGLAVAAFGLLVLGQQASGQQNTTPPKKDKDAPPPPKKVTPPPPPAPKPAPIPLRPLPPAPAPAPAPAPKTHPHAHPPATVISTPVVPQNPITIPTTFLPNAYTPLNPWGYNALNPFGVNPYNTFGYNSMNPFGYNPFNSFGYNQFGYNPWNGLLAAYTSLNSSGPWFSPGLNNPYWAAQMPFSMWRSPLNFGTGLNNPYWANQFSNPWSGVNPWLMNSFANPLALGAFTNPFGLTPFGNPLMNQGFAPFGGFGGIGAGNGFNDVPGLGVRNVVGGISNPIVVQNTNGMFGAFPIGLGR
jgi:hypothetical protein